MTYYKPAYIIEVEIINNWYPIAWLVVREDAALLCKYLNDNYNNKADPTRYRVVEMEGDNMNNLSRNSRAKTIFVLVELLTQSNNLTRAKAVSFLASLIAENDSGNEIVHGMSQVISSAAQEIIKELDDSKRPTMPEQRRRKTDAETYTHPTNPGEPL